MYIPFDHHNLRVFRDQDINVNEKNVPFVVSFLIYGKIKNDKKKL